MKLFRFVPLLALVLLFNACTGEKSSATTIDFNTCLKHDSAFLLTVEEKNQKTKAVHYEANPINQDSETHKMLLAWLKKNAGNWQTAIPSNEGSVTVSQGDFTLQYLKRRVLISFPVGGTIHHYLKNIREGELDFLLGAS